MATSSPSGGVTVWEWMNQFGVWRPYGPDVTNFLEKNKQTYKQVHLGVVDRLLNAYSVDYQSMCQIRNDTGTARPIRRMVFPMSCPVAKGVVWQWEGDSMGDWHSYSIDVAAVLEEAYSIGLKFLDLSKTPVVQPYHIDLQKMQQKRIETGNIRLIRREKLNNQYPLNDRSAPVQTSNTHYLPPDRSAPVQTSSVQQTPHIFSNKGPITSISSGSSAFISTSSNTGSRKRKRPGETQSQAWSGQNSLPLLNSSLTGLGLNSSSAPFHMPGHVSAPGNSVFFGAQQLSNTAGSIGNTPGHSLFPNVSLLGNSFNSMTNVLMSPAVPVLLSSNQTSGSAGSSGVSQSSDPSLPRWNRIPNNAPKGSKKNTQARTGAHHLLKYVNVVKTPPEEEDCCICFERMCQPSGYGSGGPDDSAVIQLQKCTHMFHKLCLGAMYDSGAKDGSIQCPTCKQIYGEKYGNCPRGEMEYQIIPRALPTHDCHTIHIQYHISPGIQGPEHPNPGKRFSTRGFPRYGYLPDNQRGRKVLRLLIVAWKRRLTFTIGSSATTGEADTVTWNEIHHKTELGSNFSGHGYPDPNYLSNVEAELALQGVTAEDLQRDQ
ncbi:hypothetical protein ScPMuIL_006261 [Solemya velum]